MTFTPPDVQLKVPKWATYVKNRNPQFKVHYQKNHATCAVNIELYGTGARGGIVYKLEEDKWIEYKRVVGPGLGD